ncbi:NAD-dependent epimerase/dehydratase family protein [Streptacidiphilus sp. P02-A3a]|uniref:NAD-dependent epimerase/dehydratase family protein n=1 Tax=Streptacidiphilus sp. P02-A3a TaxID=2704468 RepID=UPI0015FA5937|nr:NAD-dependent epimerase/dehydratase family protein [Streptacidiphilus sp. P02-A3a]QMU74118.1 NAD-dependent epimerase/dehydratase family protein [Streptacidiphilus sp. P02-A3a]
MDVLLTGGAGFIGSAIAARLAAAGHRVRVLDALLPAVHPAGGVLNLPDGVEFIRGDVRDGETVERALRGVTAVCHQAAMVGLGLDLDDAPDYVGCNDLGTAVLLAAMARAKVTELVLAGSMVVYGEGSYRCAEHGTVAPGPRRTADLSAGRFEPPCPRCGEPLEPCLVEEDTAPDPRNVYAASKVAQEHLASAWARASGGRVIVLRYHNVYGPGMPRDTPYAGVASIFRSAVARGEAPRVFEDGGQRRDFVHVADVAEANLAALRALAGREPGTFRCYNVGSGQVHTVGEMAAALALAGGGRPPVVTGQYRLGDVRHITADSRRLREELAWRPEVAFEDGMADFAHAPLRGE